MENTSGFYKKISNENCMYAPNFVSMPDTEILIELKDTYSYPVNDWYYFDTEEEAYNYFGIVKTIDDSEDMPINVVPNIF